MSVRADIAKDNMWIGFHDANGEGNFEWTDSSTITFTNWAPGEPNNAGNEDCVHLEINYYKVGMWNDLTCSREESWVCKKPKTDDNTVHTATPLPTGAFDTRCGIDWVYDSASGKCYLLRPSDYKDWAGARDQCLIEGGDLVSITSYEEENFLISLLRGVTEPTMWIGANDLTTEGGWEWTDKEPFVYFNWKSGEPNNDGPFSGGENCGELIVNQGVWNDHKCEKNFIGYICKKDKYINKYFDSYHYAFISGKDDIVLTDVYPSDCAKRCIEGTGFTCLSFDYNRNQKTCQLSSFNKDSAGGLTPTYTGDIYDHYERDMNVPTDAPPTTLPAYYGCPSGWKTYDNYCYYADNTVANFDASSMKCQNRYAGAELASVHNVGENSFLLNLVQQDLFGHSTWIGMSDNNNEGTFAWLDGSKVDFTYWGQNQPDNWYDGEDCIELRYWDGTWNDNVCSGAFTSICKMKKIDVGNTAIPTDKGCGAGWIGHEYRCVKIVNSPKTWQDAEKDCNTNNGNLMSIHDQFGQALLESELSLENGNNYWIGLSDTVTPGTYVWSDGASVSYTNWAQGQPDNSGGDCVSITSGQSSPGFWIDTNCALGLPYVCEKSRVGYTHPPHTNPPRTTPPSDQNCAPGWIGYGSSCYLPNEESSQNNRLSWLEAQQSCLKMGGDLASFHSAAEEAYILGRFTPIDQENAYWLGYWIGLNDRTIEGGYEWSDGTAVGYTNWGDGEPNDSGSEECVEMFFDGQRGWNDMDCSTVRNWICKIAKGVTPITPSPDPDAPIPCPSDSSWVYRSPYCYYVSPAYGTGRKGWQDAEDYCKSRGGHLASIHDVFEQNYVFRLVSKVIGSYWIGLREQAAGGDYKWSDGTSFDYINWAKNEPNDFNGAEQCVELEVQKLAAWNDQACGIPGPFVCKKAEDNIKPITNAPTPPPTGNCLNGWVKHSNRCYRVYGTEIADRLKWSDARSMCLAKNADLVTIHNKELQAYLSTYIKTANTDIWTGLNDRHTDGKFAWVDGTSLDFEAWAMYEPKSGVVLPDGSSSDCVKMMNSAEQTGKWDDVDCSSLNAYVCQQPLNPTLPVNPDNIEYCGQPNFRKYGDSCYMMDTTKRDFASARQLCENQNSELASIPDGYEQVFVESLVYGNNNEPVWIGMIDMKVEGEYMWLDGWPIWYTNWAENEPSKGPGEGCVRVNDDGTWEDATCTSLHYPLCKTTTAEKPVTPAPRPGTCPTSEWIPYGSHCYFFGVSFTSISWAEAEFACSLNHAGHLASIHSRAQNEFIRANVQSFLGKSVWVGLFRSDSGGFMWSDGTGVDYTFWEDGEPTMTHNGKHENCVELYPQFGYWNDENCNDGQAYVCEILKGAPVSSTDDGPNRPITPTNKDGNKEPTTGLNTGGIVGITLASCVLLLALVMIIWFVVQRKKFSFDDSKATSGIDNQLYESGTSSVQIDKKAQAEA
ncbi:macrophage mannose receptor 1-like [Antedon mediterranea]|uniref:macrophage mannose receptor 1-like n=1 Tax=Antedon mediterranea TaxID=105859 RepID=UPI003AF62B26